MHQTQCKLGNRENGDTCKTCMRQTADMRGAHWALPRSKNSKRALQLARVVRVEAIRNVAAVRVSPVACDIYNRRPTCRAMSAAPYHRPAVSLSHSTAPTCLVPTHLPRSYRSRVPTASTTTLQNSLRLLSRLPPPSPQTPSYYLCPFPPFLSRLTVTHTPSKPSPYLVPPVPLPSPRGALHSHACRAMSGLRHGPPLAMNGYMDKEGRKFRARKTRYFKLKDSALFNHRRKDSVRFYTLPSPLLSSPLRYRTRTRTPLPPPPPLSRLRVLTARVSIV